MATTRLLVESASATALRTALDTASGYPHRGVVVGAPDGLPLEYSSGAPGWTAGSGAVITSLGDGYSTLEVSEYAQDFMGVTVGDVYIKAFGEQQAVLLAGQSNARDAVVPSISALGCIFARVAVGGTGLVEHWYPGSELFNQSVAAMYGFDCVELWWIQGERDATSSAWSSAYQVNLTALLAAFRAELGPVRARLALLNSSCQYTYTSTVRQAQIDICAADALSEPLDMDGFTAYYDGLHYNATGNAAIGSAFASALETALGG